MLPPGQRLARFFPRFGAHGDDPPPTVPADPQLQIPGAAALPLAALRELPRETLVADFHCVSGWSVQDLEWEGVAFRTLWERAIGPVEGITHLRFSGLDGYSSVLLLEDALRDDVLIADRLNGEPLDGDHGAPARLVSPSQYGYMSTKHLCRIELHTREPGRARHRSPSRALVLGLLAPHPRARVAQEERHRYMPGRALRLPYRRVAQPILERDPQS